MPFITHDVRICSQCVGNSSGVVGWGEGLSGCLPEYSRSTRPRNLLDKKRPGQLTSASASALEHGEEEEGRGGLSGCLPNNARRSCRNLLEKRVQANYLLGPYPQTFRLPYMFYKISSAGG